MTEKLNRIHFETSRLLEYFSEKELRQQIGLEKKSWPIAILRELVDNSLDACETKGIPPVIEVTIEGNILTVADNGSGIPAEVIEKSLDYSKRISDKAYYVSPTRGQMGNALKVVYAAPYVLNPEFPGRVEIASGDQLHTIKITLDRIAGIPEVSHTITGLVKKGNFVRIYSPQLASLLLNDSDFTPDVFDSFIKSDAPTPEDLINGYAAFNPHSTFILNGKRFDATAPGWSKWSPSDPTSAHWYTVETLSDLIGGYLVKERQNGQHKKTVREFVSEFRGLAGTAKQKKITADFQRADISIFEKNKNIDRDKLRELLSKMKAESIAPKPQALGIIGKEHFTKWILQHGGIEQSIKYIKKTGLDNGLPYVLEIGFAVNKDMQASQIKVIGLNWSPVVGKLTDPTLSEAVQAARLDSKDSIIFLVHIVRPRFEFMDRGKTKIEL